MLAYFDYSANKRIALNDYCIAVMFRECLAKGGNPVQLACIVLEVPYSFSYSVRDFFVDVDRDEILTESQLYAEYVDAVKDGSIDAEEEPFDAYVSNCHWMSGGTLEWFGNWLYKIA